MKKLLAFILLSTIFMAVSSSNVSAANSNGCSVVSESLSSNSVLQNGNLAWTVQALCSSPYNIMNTEQGIGYLCGGGVCVNVNGRSVTNSYTYGFAFTVPLNFPIGSATLKMTARASNYTTVQEINSNFSIMVGAMTVPTTTTTIATTTTISRPSFNVCWSGWVNSYGQNDGWVLMEVYYSNSLNAYKYPNLSRPNVPVPSGGCSSLNPVAPTTTTIVTVITVPPTTTTTTTTTVAPTTTTTIYNPRITYCQATMTHYVNSVPQWNYANWQQSNEPLSTYTSSALVYPNSYKYPVPVAGCSSLNTVQTTTTTSPLVVQQKVQVAPIPVITSPVIQSPVITSPVIQSPVITLPKTISTEQENKNYESSCASQTWSVNGDCVIVSPWKYVWMNKTHTKQIRTGALCYSGKRSTATSSGACSWNGGVKNWIYYSTKSTSKVKYKCWLNKNTNTYNKNCIAV